MRARTVSLRDSLTRRLAVVLFGVGIIGAIVAYQLGARYGNLAYDRAQADDVATLADQIELVNGVVQLNLPEAALKWLLADEGELVLFRVTDLRTGKVVRTNGNLGPTAPVPAVDGETGFSDRVIGNRRMRVSTLRHVLGNAGPAILIEVAETTVKRDQMAEGILGGTILFMAVISIVAVGLVWHGIGTALAPLTLLEAEAKARSAADLTPLDPLHAPEEVRGLIVAINQMMSRVASAMQSQSHFIANAAHQLRTPLSGLRLQAQLGLKAQEPQAMHASLAEVEASAVRAANLVEKLLVLAKAETAGLLTESQAVNFYVTAQQVIERSLPLADRREVDLGLSSDSESAWVQGSETLLAELLANLVDNAILHGRHGGNVTIDIRTEPAHVCVMVIDDGPGFTMDGRDRAFTRFYQGDSGSGIGAGLGLAIVHEITQRFQGTVVLTSEPGAGSRFELRFPRAVVQVAPAGTVGRGTDLPDPASRGWQST